MNCSFCGREIKEGARFCTFCGTRAPTEQQKNIEGVYTPPVNTETVENTQSEGASTGRADGALSVKTTYSSRDVRDGASAPETTPRNDATADFFEASQADSADGKSKKGKKKAVIAIIAAALALAVLVTSFAVAFGAFGKDDLRAAVIPAYLYDGGACICFGDGKMTDIKGSVKAACITPDREKIICVKKSGELCWIDVEGSNEIINVHTFSDPENPEILALCDDVILFRDNGWIYRYIFSDRVLTQFKVDTAYNKFVISSAAGSGAGFAGAYIESGSIISFLGESGAERVVASLNHSESTILHDVSNDGKWVLWSDFDGRNYTLYLSGGGTGGNRIIKQGGENTISSRYSLNCPVDSSDKLVITSDTDMAIYVCNLKGGVTNIPFADIDGVLGVFSLDGRPYVECDRIEDSAFYVKTQNADGVQSLYLVDSDTSIKRCVAPVMTSFEICTGGVAYVDGNGQASFVPIDLKEIKVGSKVKLRDGATGVFAADINAECVYIVTEINGVSGLYRYGADQKTPVQTIASNIYPRIHVSTDGDTVYYYTSVEKRSNKGVHVGELYAYSKEQSVRINGSVMVGSLTSGLASGNIIDNAIWMEIYVSDHQSGYKFNAAFFDGKNSTSIVENIKG